MKKNFKILLIVLIFILIDQGIKIYISNNLMGKEFYILDNTLTFKPLINTKYSYYNSFFDLGIGLLPHIIMNILTILILLIVMDFIKKRYGYSKLACYLFVFLLAGAVCSLIDKVAWGGSLDYIKLQGFFTFDLKDIYIAIFEIIAILAIILNWKNLKKVNEKVVYNEFKTYINTKYFNKHV